MIRFSIVACVAAGLAGTSCQWAELSERRAYACEADGGCQNGRVCKFVEYGEGLRACVQSSKKVVNDGGLVDADGGIATQVDGGGIVPDDGGASPADAGQFAGQDAGMLDAGADAGDGGTPGVDAGDASVPDAGDSGLPDAGQCGSPHWSFDGGVFVTDYPALMANYNVIFVTSAKFTGNLGGLDGGDARCRAAAADAGLWSPDTYVALLSPFTEDGGLRFRIDGGFVRIDGLPVAPDFDALVRGRVWYPVSVTEQRAALTPSTVYGEKAWTGVLYDSSRDSYAAGSDCGGWSTVGAGIFGRVGNPFSSNLRWITQISVNCDPGSERRLYCAQTEGSCAPPRPSVPLGARLAILSDRVPANGVWTACDSVAQLTGKAFVPLVASDGESAVQKLIPDAGGRGPIQSFATVWVRPDDVVVTARPGDLVTIPLLASIDETFTDAGAQKATLPNGDDAVWTGSVGALLSGDAGTTCGSWASVSSSTVPALGSFEDVYQWYLSFAVSGGCNGKHRVYCVEP